MPFLHAIDDFGIIIRRRVGKLLTRQRENDSSMFFSWSQSYAGSGIRDFEFRPFVPKVNSRRCFQDIRDIRAAYAGRDFEEIEITISLALDELGMRRARFHSHGFEEAAIYLQKLFFLRRIVRNGLGNVRAAAMRDLQWRTTILVHAGKDYASFIDQ